MFWAPLPPVSYSQQVDRIFAYRCNGCHGEAGGLSLRSYEAVMAGGNKGRVILAGDADGSLLVQYVDGRRGQTHRMPLGGRPLSAAEIGSIRQWIDEGATQDDALPKNTRSLRNVKMEPGKKTRITCRIPGQAYVVIRALDPVTKTSLWMEESSIKSPKEQYDLGRPGELVQWELAPGPNWPATVTLELTLKHTAVNAADVEFSATLLR